MTLCFSKHVEEQFHFMESMGCCMKLWSKKFFLQPDIAQAAWLDVCRRALDTSDDELVEAESLFKYNENNLRLLTIKQEILTSEEFLRTLCNIEEAAYRRELEQINLYSHSIAVRCVVLQSQDEERIRIKKLNYISAGICDFPEIDFVSRLRVSREESCKFKAILELHTTIRPPLFSRVQKLLRTSCASEWPKIESPPPTPPKMSSPTTNRIVDDATTREEKICSSEIRLRMSLSHEQRRARLQLRREHVSNLEVISRKLLSNDT